MITVGEDSLLVVQAELAGLDTVEVPVTAYPESGLPAYARSPMGVASSPSAPAPAE